MTIPNLDTLILLSTKMDAACIQLLADKLIEVPNNPNAFDVYFLNKILKSDHDISIFKILGGEGIQKKLAFFPILRGPLFFQPRPTQPSPLQIIDLSTDEESGNRLK